MRKLYTAEQLAERYSVKPHTVYMWGKRGTVERVKVGGRVMFYDPAEKEESKCVAN